jgi:hypothetical protein
MIAAAVCVLSIGLLLLSRHERMRIPPWRFLVHRLLPKLDPRQRFYRVNLICGVLLATCAAIEVIAFIFPRLGQH